MTNNSQYNNQFNPFKKIPVQKPTHRISGEVVAIADGYYNNQIHKEGRQFRYEGFGKKLPMWCRAVEGKEIKVVPVDAEGKVIVAPVAPIAPIAPVAPVEPQAPIVIPSVPSFPSLI